ncbi:quinone oxidoreductase [Tabrizicola sp.]|uniref:quinone oxidoreductase family protein n=1 Tax=Tabrizicola sp. TaxID=2005166 RepID=UPI001A3F6A13|nr:quinone oxidoreductase [Tabrizicola sp.]MBL9061703.1 quinone oxidoreductase [Tabrizicola sp.]
MAKAFLFSEFGSVDVLNVQELDVPLPGKGEIRLRQRAIGVNYIDIYHRRGVFAPKLPLPSGIGVEGVGVVVAVGEGVAGFYPGDRVAYVGGPPGAYATERNVPAARALKVPDGLSDDVVAATIFKGLTAEYLTHRCIDVQVGDNVLFHAAAGGVGSIACQWLKAKGARVIGTVGSEAKARLALSNGCDDVILYRKQDFAARVRELTDGTGVRVVYDSVGADTFAGSLKSLRPRGLLVSFGETSGPVPPVEIAQLGSLGSLYLTRPSIAHYTSDRKEFEAAGARLFSALLDGTIRPGEITGFALEDAALAQAAVENRKTVGSVVLKCS